MGGVGIGTVLIGQPLFTAVVTVLASTLVLLSPLWATAFAISRYLFSLLIWDLDYVEEKGHYVSPVALCTSYDFPPSGLRHLTCFTAILYDMGMMGVVNIATAVTAAGTTVVVDGLGDETNFFWSCDYSICGSYHIRWQQFVCWI